MKNIDKIRAMSAEELGTFLGAAISDCSVCHLLMSIKEYCGKHEHCDTCIYWKNEKICIFEGNPADWRLEANGN